MKLLERGGDRRRGRAGAEVVDALEDDHPADAALAEHVAHVATRSRSARGPRSVTALPPMPWFITATSSRWARWPAAASRRSSGQRSLPFVVEPRPSVIESPSTTTPFADASGHHVDARQDVPVIGGLRGRGHVRGADGDAAGLLVPGGARSRVAGDVAGHGAERGGDARLLSGASVKSTGSDQTALPCAIVDRRRSRRTPAPVSVAGVDRAVDRVAGQTATCAAIDRHRAVAELVREADADLAAAQRDVHDLAQRRC